MAVPRAAIAMVVFLGTFALRIRGVSEHFILLADQMRDWSIAMRSFVDLPLVGPPTHVGGYTLGPAFYWILWLIRVCLGPLFDNLPHAGGIGQAAVQSAADAVLMVAIWRRTNSPWIALVTIVLVATASFDLSLAAVVWNPTMGTALAKVAIAAVLLDWHRGSAFCAAMAIAATWSAVQAYTGAVFVAVGVILAFLVDPLARGDHRMLKRNLIVSSLVVVLLQLPYAIHQITHRFDAPAMGAVTGSVARVLSGRDSPEIRKSVDGYVSAITYVQVAPWKLPAVGWMLLLCGGVVAVRHFKDPALLSVVLVPQVTAVAGYALFLSGLDTYYYLSLMPSAVLTVVLALLALTSGRTSQIVGVLMLVVSLAMIPEGFVMSKACRACQSIDSSSKRRARSEA